MSFTMPLLPQLSLTAREEELRQFLLQVADYVASQGNPRPVLRFTGGWVRDKLLGVTSHDIDIGIDNMTGCQFGESLNNFLRLPESGAWVSKVRRNKDSSRGSSDRADVKVARIKANPEKSKHLETAATVLFDFEVDLVNLRKETYTDTSRTPQMAFGTAEEDALRRDSTINALFFHLDTANVEDFTKRGLTDLSLGVIKTPLPPFETFREDPLRVLRAIRFAARLSFSIADEDQRAMQDSSIQQALLQKISRERIGAEIGKMLAGPDPRAALSLIDTLGLYFSIFSDPTSTNEKVDLCRWRTTYNSLHAILHPDSKKGVTIAASTFLIKEVLLGDEEHIHAAWILACHVPWSSVTGKTPDALASLGRKVAREGLQADNKTVKLVSDAFLFLPSVREFIGQLASDTCDNSPCEHEGNKKRKRSTLDRGQIGMILRSWGARWRSTIFFSFLADIAQASDRDIDDIISRYGHLCQRLVDYDLLAIHEMKPLVNGNMISQLFPDQKPGPWLKRAMDFALEWQIQNPETSNTQLCLSAIQMRKHELRLKVNGG